MNQSEEILRLNRAVSGLKTRHERIVDGLERELETLRRKYDSASVRLARYQREHYRLTRAAMASERLRETLSAKEAALAFSISRQEVLRRKLNEAKRRKR